MEKLTLSPTFATRLPEVAAGRASSLDVEVLGVPDGLDNLELHVKVGESFAIAPARRVPGGAWRVYASGAFFPAAGAFPYHLTARDALGNSRWLGSGRVRVEESVLNVDGAEVPPIPADTYVRNPVTGLYHLLTVTADEDGSLTPEIADEGITR